ncbi:MAG: hypothetical protein MJ141_04115 [Clostridia bacterium]|nr:hypothetical protein [Clostridia bacterium]
MFDNIGGKIKGLATAICILGIIAAVIGGISIMISDEYLFLTGLLVMVVGSVISWVGSFTIYGFGELIESTANIEAQLYSNNNNYNHIFSGAPSNASAPVNPVNLGRSPSSIVNTFNASEIYATEEYDSNRPIPPSAVKITGTCELCHKTGTTTFIADVMDRASGEYDQHRVCLQCYRHYRCKPSETK